MNASGGDGREYLALEADSPERWSQFATQHPAYKAAVVDEDGGDTWSMGLPAGALDVSAATREDIQQAIEIGRLQQEEALKAMGIPKHILETVRFGCIHPSVMEGAREPVWKGGPLEIGPTEKMPPAVAELFATLTESVKLADKSSGVLDGEGGVG